MPNPPKFDPARGLRGRHLTHLPAGGRTGKPPQWPLPGKPSPAEVQAWAQLWATPQAAAWERMGVGTARVVARYARLLVRAEEPDAGATLLLSVNALEDRLGLTPKALRLLLWDVATDEVAEKRQQQPARSARERMRAVDPA